MDHTTYSGIWTRLQRAIAEGWAIQPAYREITAHVVSRHRDPALKKISGLRIGDDIDALSEWFSVLLAKDPPGPKIKGIWFGLVEEAEGPWTLYVCGNSAYSTKDMNWACNPRWWPKQRYASSKTLTALSALRPRHDYELRTLIEMSTIFPFAVLACVEITRRADPALLLGKSKKRGVACGFDAGDFLPLGVVTPRRFEPHRAK